MFCYPSHGNKYIASSGEVNPYFELEYNLLETDRGSQ